MDPSWIAALPMYDFPQLRAAHDALWSALAGRMVAMGLANVPRELTRNLGHSEVWRHPGLLFGQGCEYPLATSFANCVRLVATPRYGVPGCEGFTYRSAIVVRSGDPAEALADLRNRACVINEVDSNSGMNLLRAALAPLAAAGRFFGSVEVSGSHLRSVETVADGQADVAAVDCVTFAHLRRIRASVVGEVRVLGWTPSSPCLPFIAGRATSDSTVQVLREALAAVFADAGLREVREELFLDGVDLEPDEGFGAVLALERGAAQLGYPTVV